MGKFKVRPLVRYHGGKGHLYKWILSNFPDYETYVEPFGGGASVLLNKEPSPKEIYNDFEPSIYNLFSVVQQRANEFIEILKPIPHRKEVYIESLKIYESSSFNSLPPLEQAKITYIVLRQSRAGTATTYSWSKRIHKGIPEEEYGWESSKINILNVQKRIKNVTLLNENALDIISNYYEEKTFFYLDPPYLENTRVSKKVYKKEMPLETHIDLLDLINQTKSKIMLSGYSSKLYEEKLKSWNKLCKNSILHSSHAKTKTSKVECLWTNY